MDLDATKTRILEAAGAVFGQKGFEGGTVRDICQSAGVNLAAVNYHFGDKQRLYIEAVKYAHLLRAQAVPLPEWGPDVPAERRLHDFVEVLLIRMLGEDDASWHAQLLLREVGRPNAACEELVRDHIRPHSEVLRGVLRELVPADVPDERVMLLAFSVVGQCLFYRTAQAVVRLLMTPERHEQLAPAMLADHITGVMLAALGLRPPVGAEECVR